MPLATVEEAIAEFREGRFVILVDDEDRENEGDLAIAAEFVGAEEVHFMAREGRGLICVPMTGERLDHLGLEMMVPPTENTATFATAFTVSVDARRGVTTGISAHDRAATIRTLIDPGASVDDFARPGHIFPLRAEEAGVLARAGQTEASVDLARLAGLYPAAVICEILAEDGHMARRPELERLARRHDLKIVSVADLVAYRGRTESFVVRVGEARLPTAAGDFRALLYEEVQGGERHLALLHGEPTGDPPLVRLHSECLTGDALGSVRCDCGAQLREAQRRVVAAGHGVVLYLRQEGRGVGLLNKMLAYALQDDGLDTVEANHQLGLPADARDYRTAARILEHLGLERVRLLTNNPAKVDGLRACGIDVVEREPLLVPATEETRRYLEAKREKLGHLLPN